MDKDVEKMIKNTPKSDIISDRFYSKLDRATQNYIKDYNEENTDYEYSLIEENNKTTRGQERNFLLKKRKLILNIEKKEEKL